MDDLGLSRMQKREPYSTELTRQLVHYLLSGRPRVGQRIPSERQLAEALSVGRSAVRDALRPLATLGLLDIRIGDGTYLNDPDTELLPHLLEWGMLLGQRRVLDLVEARGVLEPIVAGLAAERCDRAAVEEMRRRLGEMERATTVDAFRVADTALHLKIAEASGNTAFAGMLHGSQALLAVWIERVLAAEDGFGPSYREHVPIVAAIAEADPEGARAAMEAHMVSATRRLKKTLEPGANPPA